VPVPAALLASAVVVIGQPSFLAIVALGLLAATGLAFFAPGSLVLRSVER
jgi:hypothetical protein